MNIVPNFKKGLVVLSAAGALLLAGCNKEEMTTVACPQKDVVVGKVQMTERQQRTAQDMYSRMPKLRYWDEAHHRFIELSNGSRDLVFADPDEGFSFDDPDGNGAMVFSDGSGDYLVFSAGFGVAGNGGGGTVVAGNTALNIDIAVCVSMEAIAEGDGYGDMFDSGFAFSNYSAVFGIAGDFEGLMDADTESDDFDPFEFLFGYAAYYVLSDDVNGNHEVFDWLDADGTEDFDDFASSFVMDFQNFDIYFATGGTINVAGGQMTFNGTYLSLVDIFESFLNEGLEDGDEPEFDEVTGFGTMGCN